MPVSLAHVLAEENLRAAWKRTKKRVQFAYYGERGDDIECDAAVLGDALAAPVSAVRELLADVTDLAEIGAGFGSIYRLDLTAAPVCSFEIEGRVVYGHDIRTRVLQRAFVQAVGAEVEKALPATVFSYRAGRDRWTALLGARRAIARGFMFVAKVDVRRFFPSVRVDQVVVALMTLIPELDEALVRLVVWFCTAPIIGQTSALAPALHALYQGSIAAPPLSNLVGAHVLDLPLVRYAPKGVHAFRYGDDVLLLGADARAVTHARDIVVELIEEAGWEAHPEKTFECAHDLRDAPIRWLGKTVGVSGVSTPPEKLAERVDALVELPRGDERVGAMAAALVNEMFLDRRAVVDAAVAKVTRRSPRHGRAARNMVAHFEQRRRKRMRAYDAVLSTALAARG
ncbi:MAG: reverse transcriptase domain-containing protein [Sandaracinus sp.]